jgi:drug/metabolite transporter (DMT)-like permease
MTATPRPRRASVLGTASGTNVHDYTLSDWGLLGAIALIWGSSFLFIELGLRAFEPTVVSALRIGLGAATVAAFRRSRQPVEREDWPRIAVLGLVWMAIPLLLFPIAQQWISSSLSGMVNGAMPIFTALWATYLLRRLPGWRQLLGIGVGFAGVLLIFVGLASNLSVPLAQRYGSLPVVLRAQLVALVILLPLGLLGLPGSSWSLESALAMLPLGILGTGVAFALMATLTGRVGGPRASIAIYFLPLVAIVLGVLVLGESVAPIAVGGVVLVMAGAWIASRREA